jgi:hypothetical protein
MTSKREWDGYICGYFDIFPSRASLWDFSQAREKVWERACKLNRKRASRRRKIIDCVMLVYVRKCNLKWLHWKEKLLSFFTFQHSVHGK